MPYVRSRGRVLFLGYRLGWGVRVMKMGVSPVCLRLGLFFLVDLFVD